jgi:hypothetical protein
MYYMVCSFVIQWHVPPASSALPKDTCGRSSDGISKRMDQKNIRNIAERKSERASDNERLRLEAHDE